MKSRSINNWKTPATNLFLEDLIKDVVVVEEGIGLSSGIDDGQDNVVIMRTTNNSYDIDAHKIIENIAGLIATLNVDSLDIDKVNNLSSIEKQLRDLF